MENENEKSIWQILHENPPYEDTPGGVALKEVCEQSPWLSDGAILRNGYNINDYPLSPSQVNDLDDLCRVLQEGNWGIRSSFVWEDLAFIQQSNGGDEWAVFKHKPDGGWTHSFESLSVEHLHPARLKNLVLDIHHATPEECKELSYGGAYERHCEEVGEFPIDKYFCLEDAVKEYNQYLGEDAIRDFIGIYQKNPDESGSTIYTLAYEYDEHAIELFTPRVQESSSTAISDGSATLIAKSALPEKLMNGTLKSVDAGNTVYDSPAYYQPALLAQGEIYRGNNPEIITDIRSTQVKYPDHAYVLGDLKEKTAKQATQAADKYKHTIANVGAKAKARAAAQNTQKTNQQQQKKQPSLK